jgi:predicted NUDIX family NTP pyrophosphohydrolase
VASKDVSVGILLFRRAGAGIEVLLGHPGGPFFERRDEGVWSVPKGLVEEGEDLLAVGEREFLEETGQPVPDGERVDLGSIVQKGGKTVHAWAVEGDLDPSTAKSNTFTMEWPPRSGSFGTFPEIDRVAWFAPAEARRKINPGQIPLIDRLEAALGART